MREHIIYSTIDGTIRVTITGDIESVQLNVRENEAYMLGNWSGEFYRVDLATGEVVEIPQAQLAMDLNT